MDPRPGTHIFSDHRNVHASLMQVQVGVGAGAHTQLPLRHDHPCRNLLLESDWSPCDAAILPVQDLGGESPQPSEPQQGPVNPHPPFQQAHTRRDRKGGREIGQCRLFSVHFPEKIF